MFPTIKHIDDVLPAIAGKEEFIVVERDGFTVIDYVWADNKTFTGPNAEILRECRGLKFDGETGYLIARPLHKFHNLGETAETMMDAIPWDQPHDVYDKLDGSMVHPAIVKGELVFMTRMGTSDQAKQALTWAEKSAHKLLEDCTWWMRQGWTPVFEWTAPYNRIVVPYAEEKLTLLALRRNDTGEYNTHFDTFYGFPAVKRWEAPKRAADVPAFLERIRALEGEEGVVIRFNGGNGLWVKVKADQYVLQHRAKDGINLEKNALAVVLENKEDDVAALLPSYDRDRLLEYAKDVRHGISLSVSFLDSFLSSARKRFTGDRKAFALHVTSALPKPIQGPAFKAWSGEDVRGEIMNILKKHTGSQTAVDEIRQLIGGATWSAVPAEAV